MSDKSEEPTPRRLRKAHAEGDVAVSGALVSVAAFLTALGLTPPAVEALAGWARSSLRAALEAPRGGTELGPDVIAALWATLALAAPLLVPTAAVAALVAAVQAGGVIAPAKVLPDLGRLSPAKGLAGLFSAQRVVGVARALVTAAAVVLIAWHALIGHAADFAAAVGSPAKAVAVAAWVARRLARDVGLVLLATAALDFALTRHAWRQRHRMTKDEVKREAKESEGDPHIKAARERAHHELLAQASINAVRDATVVVVNPTHLAAALRYRDGDDDAPELIAKGEGAFAARIIEAARAWGVPVVRDVPLARALVELEPGDQIPEALYEAVAETLRALWEDDVSSGSRDDP